jgi:hypothetical protein
MTIEFENEEFKSYNQFNPQVSPLPHAVVATGIGNQAVPV